MIKPEVIDALVSAGCTVEQLAAAWKADVEACPQLTARQARNARYYDAKCLKASESVLIKTVKTSQDAQGAPSPSPDGVPLRDIIKPLSLTPSAPSPNNTDASAPERPRKKYGIAENEQPTASDLDFAGKNGLDRQKIREEWAQFRDHHRKLDSRFSDWRAAWRTWVRNVKKFAPAVRAGPSGGKSIVSIGLEMLEEMRRADEGEPMLKLVGANYG